MVVGEGGGGRWWWEEVVGDGGGRWWELYALNPPCGSLAVYMHLGRNLAGYTTNTNVAFEMHYRNVVEESSWRCEEQGQPLQPTRPTKT